MWRLHLQHDWGGIRAVLSDVEAAEGRSAFVG